MLTYKELKNIPSRFLAMTSLTIEEFEELVKPFRSCWDDDVEKRREAKPRQRKAGGGRKPALKCLEDMLLFILIYLKIYPLQEVQGLLFGMSQGQANDWIQRLMPIVQAALKKEDLLPERDPANLEQVLAEHDLLEFTIDGTERRIQRPVDNTEQREYYSGKKKAHTVTNNLIGHAVSRTVCYLSETYPGKRHDKRICDEEGYTFPRCSQLFQDTGFQGYAPEDVISYQPKKKPRGGELDLSERFINAVISKSRIVVENIICGVKRCRILKDTFRNHIAGFDDKVLEIACGLHNLRVRHRHSIETFDLFDFIE